jgi:ABC-type nickel/cobalt efflux system permease component RcnA
MMIASRHAGRRWWRRPAALLGLLAVLLALLMPTRAASAHPLDQYVQATYITVAPAQIVVELVAPETLALLDTDGDGQITDAEGRAYADQVVRNVAVQVDGQAVALTITKVETPTYLAYQAGYGTMRVFTAAPLAPGLTGTHVVTYANNNAPTGATYQVNTFIENGAAISLGKQNRDETQRSITVDYTIGGATAATAATAANPAATAATTNAAATGGATIGTSGQAQRLLAYLDAPSLTPWALATALGLALVLGGLHALTPGHGKTLVAAYLVGSRGKVRHAVALGGIVTFTHTASVIVIGLLALFASRYVVPGVLVPILEIASGLLVVGLGGRLIWQRWRAFRQSRARVNPAHEHDGALAGPLTHDHGDGRMHTHLPPSDDYRVGGILAMGISGGLIPCPEALGVLIIAIGLNHVLLGLGLIVSFSLGLAVVLIAIGILLVRARSLVERFGGRGGGRWGAALPLASAVIVTVLGIGITLGGLASYLG